MSGSVESTASELPVGTLVLDDNGTEWEKCGIDGGWIIFKRPGAQNPAVTTSYQPVYCVNGDWHFGKAT